VKRWQEKSLSYARAGGAFRKKGKEENGCWEAESRLKEKGALSFSAKRYATFTGGRVFGKKKETTKGKKGKVTYTYIEGREDKVPTNGKKKSVFQGRGGPDQRWGEKRGLSFPGCSKRRSERVRVRGKPSTAGESKKKRRGVSGEGRKTAIPILKKKRRMIPRGRGRGKNKRMPAYSWRERTSPRRKKKTLHIGKGTGFTKRDALTKKS